MDNQTVNTAEKTAKTPAVFMVGDSELNKKDFYNNLNKGTLIFLDTYQNSWGEDNTELVAVAINDLIDGLNKNQISINQDDNGLLFLEVVGKNIPLVEEGQFDPYKAAAYMITSTADAMRQPKNISETKKTSKKYGETTFLENFMKSLSPTGNFDVKYWMDLDEETDKERPYTNRLGRFNAFLNNELKNLDSYDSVAEVFGSKDDLKAKMLDLQLRIADGNISADDNLAFTALGFDPRFFDTGISAERKAKLDSQKIALLRALVALAKKPKPGLRGFLMPNSPEFNTAVLQSWERHGYDLNKWNPLSAEWYIDKNGNKLYIVKWKTMSAPKVPLSLEELLAALGNRVVSDDLKFEDKARIAAVAQDVASVFASFMPTYGTAAAAGLGLTSMGTNLVADLADSTVPMSSVFKNVAINTGMAVAGSLPGVKIARTIKNLAKLAPHILTAINAAGIVTDPETKTTLNKLITSGENAKLTLNDWKRLVNITATLAAGTRIGVGAYRLRQYSGATTPTTTNYKIKTKTTDAEGKVTETNHTISEALKATINKSKTQTEADNALNAALKENNVNIPEGSKVTLGEGKFPSGNTGTGYKGKYKSFKESFSNEKVKGTPEIVKGESSYTPEQLLSMKDYRSAILKRYPRLDNLLSRRLRTNYEIWAEGKSPFKPISFFKISSPPGLDKAPKAKVNEKPAESVKSAESVKPAENVKPAETSEVKPKVETEVKPKTETEVKPKVETEVKPKTEPEIDHTPLPTAGKTIHFKPRSLTEIARDRVKGISKESDLLATLSRYKDGTLKNIIKQNKDNLSESEYNSISKLLNKSSWKTAERGLIRLFILNHILNKLLASARSAAEAMVSKAAGGLKFVNPYQEITIPSWYDEVYPYKSLINWNASLNKDKANPTITSPQALHSNAGNLQAAFGKNDAYIGRPILVGLDILNYADNSNYITLNDLMAGYNTDIDTIEKHWTTPLYYGKLTASIHNPLFRKLYKNRSGEGTEIWDIGYDELNLDIEGSSTWLRRADRYPEKFDPNSDEHLLSRVHKIALRNGETGYVYKENDGKIGVITDPEVIKRIELLRTNYLELPSDSTTINPDRLAGVDTLTGEKPKFKPTIDNREELLENITLNSLRAGRLIGDIFSTNERARKLREALRRISLPQAAHKYHQIMDDYAGNLVANNLAAGIINKFSRPVTSDAQVNTLRQLEGFNKANDIIQKLLMTNLDTILKHILTAENYANENRAADVQTANTVGEILTNLNRMLGNVEQLRSASNLLSIDNYLMQVEKDAATKINDRKALREAYKLNKLGTVNLRIKWALVNDYEYQKARAAYSLAINETDPEKQLSPEKISQLAANLLREQARVQKEAVNMWNNDYLLLYNLPDFIFTPQYDEYLGDLAKWYRPKYQRGGIINTVLNNATSRANSLDVTYRENLRARRADNDRFMKSIWKAIDTYLQLSKRLKP